MDRQPEKDPDDERRQAADRQLSASGRARGQRSPREEEILRGDTCGRQALCQDFSQKTHQSVLFLGRTV